MSNVLVEIRGPGGLAKVAEKDVKAYLRRDGYALVAPPKADKPKDKKELKKGEAKKKPITDAPPADDPKKTKAALKEAAKKEAADFKELLEDVKTMTTPELEMVVDRYDLGIALSQIGLVADRRKAVTKALREKMKKG